MGLISRYIIDFAHVYKEDEDLVGKKAHELGILRKLSVLLPDGFIITSEFFKEYLRVTGIDREISKVQAQDHPAIADTIKKLFHPVQEQIINKHIPPVLSVQLHKFYRKLSGIFNEASMNIFSSSSNNKSITFSDVKGDTNLILKIKTIWSMTLEKPVAIVVQKNMQSKIKGKILTNNPIINKKLTEAQMNKLLDYCKIIQKHFYFPKEIEYMIKNGKIFVTKINPFTGTVSKVFEPKTQNIAKNVLVKGHTVNPGIVTGPVKILHNRHNDIDIKKGDIVVLPNLSPSLFKKMKNAKAIIIDSIFSNALDKTLYREAFKIPTIEGVSNAAKIFKNGKVVTVNGISGEIYSGGLIY